MTVSICHRCMFCVYVYAYACRSYIPACVNDHTYARALDDRRSHLHFPILRWVDLLEVWWVIHSQSLYWREFCNKRSVGPNPWQHLTRTCRQKKQDIDKTIRIVTHNHTIRKHVMTQTNKRMQGKGCEDTNSNPEPWPLHMWQQPSPGTGIPVSVVKLSRLTSMGSVLKQTLEF